LVGIGIAVHEELTGIRSRISAAPGVPINTGTESATIRLDSTGSVTGSFGIASHSRGLETTLAQVIADELAARIEDIRILQGDSAVVAHSTGTEAIAIAGGNGSGWMGIIPFHPGRPCSQSSRCALTLPTPRPAGTSADRGFRAGRHGGGVVAPFRGGSPGP
jgi:hypothetical protein